MTTPDTPKTIRLHPKAERQRHMRELLNSTAYINPDTGDVYDPEVMAEDPDPDDEEEGNR